MTVAGWRTAYRDIVAPEKLADLPIDRWRHEIGVGLRRPVDDAFTYVAEIDGALPATASSPLPRATRTWPLMSPSWSRCTWIQNTGGAGAGAALMEAALGALASLPYTKRFCGRSRRTGARSAFYERLGWRSDDTEKIHSRSGRRAVRYTRPIEDAGRPQQ